MRKERLRPGAQFTLQQHPHLLALSLQVHAAWEYAREFGAMAVHLQPFSLRLRPLPLV